jgi:dienelactone hydrolase
MTASQRIQTAFLVLFFSGWVTVSAQTPEEPALAKDLHEEIHRIDVTVKDLYNRSETKKIPLTVFKPNGEGPFPLVILNHGRAGSADKRMQPLRFRYEAQARYLVGKGFVVIVPTRVGYGEAFGDFDPETNGGCSTSQIEPMSIAASEQVLAAHSFAKSLKFVDANRWWVMGQSVGGLTSVATVWRNPPGLQGGINFAGGTGGDPVARPGQSCGVTQIVRLWKNKAKEAQADMLWLYWENDLFWGQQAPRDWHQAWTEGGGRAQFHQLPASGKDGHSGFTSDMDHWVPLVDAYLAKAGFTQSALPPVPEATGFADVADLSKVPISADNVQKFYTRFLSSPVPRAFAIGTNGAVGFAYGDWAIGRALGFCQARRGAQCKLYAVDQKVVWRN